MVTASIGACSTCLVAVSRGSGRLNLHTVVQREPRAHSSEQSLRAAHVDLEMTPAKFEGIASERMPEAKKAVYVSCPDQCVGTLAALHGASDFCRSDLKAVPSQNRVILVMESPHKAEFENGMPIGPANGPTGVNIRNLLRQVLLSVVPVSENSQLVLMNAVQYQCSLGESTKIHRDAVFQEVWRQGGKDDFRKRLSGIFSCERGDLVINACTRGNSRESLRDMVKEVIDGVVGEHWRTAHPYSWKLPVRTKAVRQPRIEAPDSSDHLS